MTKNKGLAVVTGFLSKHRNIALVSLAVLLLSTSLVGAADFGGGAQTVVNCSAEGSCDNAITNGGSETFGANQYEETDLISLHLTDDLTVDDDVVVTGDLAVTGDITGEYLPHVSQTAIVSVTTTQEVCDMTNDGTTPRRVVDVGAQFGTNVSAAIANLTVTSNYGGAATTGTALTNLLADRTWTLSSASSSFSASSTAGFDGYRALDVAQATWDPGEHLVYMVGSPTTTLTGTCYALWTSY